MALTFPTPVNSLIRFAQMMAERLAMGLAERLGIGRCGHTVFLPRAEHKQLAAEIAFIEALTRRALFLIAATFGALPPLAPRAGPAAPELKPAPKPASAPAPSQASRAPHVPRLLLTEPLRSPTPKAGLPVHPAQIAWARPPREAPAALLPAGRLVRRYQALEAVFDNPWPHIARMRRRIGRAPGALLPVARAADAPGPHIPLVNRRILRALQAQVERAARRLDTG